MPIKYLVERLHIRGTKKIVPANRPFMIRIDTTNAGSASDQFVLPLNSSYLYDFDINWGDGVAERVTANANKTHVYDTPGVYDISIYRIFPSINFKNQGDKAKIINILQWGNTNWSTMERSFYGCSNLTIVSATDAPDLSNVESMYATFADCYNLTNIDVSNWNMANIKSIYATFYGCFKLTNIDVSNWNTANVESLIYTFAFCYNLTNIDVSNWNTANVKSMLGTFYGCSGLNPDISIFNISSLTTATNMMKDSAFGNSNYNLMLTTWNEFGTNNVSFHAGTAKYSAGLPEAAKASMISRGWTITDGGLEP